MSVIQLSYSKLLKKIIEKLGVGTPDCVVTVTAEVLGSPLARLLALASILGHNTRTGTCMVSGVRTTRKFPVGSAADFADSPTRSTQAYPINLPNSLVNPLVNNNSPTKSLTGPKLPPDGTVCRTSTLVLEQVR
uniref:Uncharacterized protein n=1 Tax=Ananas comosus var. bracteatus TaxID=296719 RepID=A0A6V7NHG0_ANACO|nr:unnamed protein product [Ananas comosus var. bracteatus]